MTLEQLKALDAVVQHGSIRAAARHIHKTAPAVSTLIKNLEKDVEITLLSREGYRPKLTDEGQIFYAKAKRLLIEMNELSALSQRISGHKELIVNIAINAVCPLQTVLAVLRKIDKRHPETQINVSTEQMGGAMERLSRGEVEIAITTSTGLQSGYMEAYPIFSIPIFPVVHRDHPLANVDQLISEHQASQYTQVIVRDSSRFENKQTLDVIEGGRHCHVTDFLTKKEVIESGLGWGGLPEYMVKKELKSGKLKRIVVENFELRQSHQYIIRRLEGGRGIVAQDIWQELITVLYEEPP